MFDAMKRKDHLVLALVVMLSGFAGLEVRAMSQGESEPVTIACVATGAKARPAALCDLFLTRLQAAYPDRRIAMSEGGQADLILTVSALGSHRVEARLDQLGRTGTPMGTARRGKALDTQALSRFLDRLIASTPLS